MALQEEDAREQAALREQREEERRGVPHESKVEEKKRKGC